MAQLNPTIAVTSRDASARAVASRYADGNYSQDQGCCSFTGIKLRKCSGHNYYNII